MNTKSKQILKLNQQFYQSIHHEFSSSRKNPWKGWERVVSNFNVEGHFSIMDLGCGNGRFYNFLKERYGNFSYTGYDTNNDLISISKQKLSEKDKSKIKFIKKDIFENISSIKNKFDLIVGFGITHHIPDKDFRKKWFEYLPQLLKRKGFLVLTFWQFAKSSGDYLVDWNNKSTARFCHQYSKKELKELINLYKSKDLKLLDQYESDNKNIYLIFGKI